MRATDPEHLIDKYLEGTCSPEELEQLQQWFREYGLTEDTASGHMGEQPGAEQSQRMYANVMKGILSPVKTTRPQEKTVRRSWLKPAAAAAVAGIALLSSLLWWQRGHHASATALHRVRNTSDTITLVQLADGSSVWLNKNASLEWNEEDFSQARSTTLKGEAYFEVAHDAAHPFTVQSNGTRTTVLGTTFKISTDASGDETTVMLFTGKVRLEAGSLGPRVLAPGEALAFNNSRKAFHTVPVPFYALAWKNKEFRCSGEPLGHVIAYLSEYYHTPVNMREELRSLRFSGTISLKEPLNAVLDQLLFVHQLHYQQTAGSIRIY